MIDRRLERLEEQLVGSASVSGGRPDWYTEEQWSERQRRFAELFGELGMPWPPEPKTREEIREELFALVEEYNESIRGSIRSKEDA